MPEIAQPAPVRSNSIFTRIIVVLAVAVVAFLAGFLPVWTKARAGANRLGQANRELAISQIQNSLASATIDARRAEYESARQAASQFFTQLRAEADRGKDSALATAQRAEAEKLFTQRDDIITLLARSDPVSAERLTGLYVAYRKLMSQAAQPAP
jgi:predicted exporter